MGNQALASLVSKFLNDTRPSFFAKTTQLTQTVDWIHSKRKFIEKLTPDTTYCSG